MKKAFDQTVRDLKRGVNKKVLKVPSIEQKVLDATSNEPWGPHGTLLADIAQASRNYQEYQMIMSILWKRINDIGKNWRHVYKALTVLEYLVAHGAERAIEDIREHAHQIQTLSDFQYIDSGGRDQGHNVRKKSQNIVVLVNDKERIHEVRQKAAANREKFQNSSTGSMYRPGSHATPGGYGERFDDRYGSRDEGRNGYGREREYNYTDDDRYRKYGDSYSRDGDRYSGEYAEQYGRDDDRGRSSSVDASQYGARSGRSDNDRDRVYEDNGQDSSSASSGKLNHSYSEQNLTAPPNYEEAAGTVVTVDSERTPAHSNWDGETSAAAHKSSSPPACSGPAQETGTAALAPSSSAPAVNNKEADRFDEFDPRGTFPAAPTTSSGEAPTISGNGEMDLFVSLSDSFTDKSSALVPTTSYSTDEVERSTNFASGSPTKGFNDPFGDGPFKAIPSTDGAPGHQQSHSVPSFLNASNSGPELPQQVSQDSAVAQFPAATSTSSGDTNVDLLADIFPLSGHQHPVDSLPEYQATVDQAVPQSMNQSGQIVSSTFLSSSGPNAHQTNFPVQSGHTSSINSFPIQSGQLVMHPNFSSQFGQPAPQEGFPVYSQPSSMTGSISTAPQAKDKFETKSTVWTDTLSRGLVNLNISGPKTNPLSDIGVDFDALNRKEKRMEKPSATPVTSTVHMGKAMGSGSGIGRAGTAVFRPISNTMMGAGAGMGMGMAGPGPGVGMAGYAGMNQQPMGVGIGMNMAPNMGMGMNMGMGAQMQRPMGFPPASTMPGGYNPMMGTGNYGRNTYGVGYSNNG